MTRHSARAATALAALAALSLAACATAQLKLGQTLSVAQTAVATAATAAHVAYQGGVIGKPLIVQIDKLADLADDVSLTARCAYAAGDTASAGAAITEVATLAAAMVALRTGQAEPSIPDVLNLACANPAPVNAVVVPAS